MTALHGCDVIPACPASVPCEVRYCPSAQHWRTAHGARQQPLGPMPPNAHPKTTTCSNRWCACTETDDGPSLRDKRESGSTPAGAGAGQNPKPNVAAAVLAQAPKCRSTQVDMIPPPATATGQGSAMSLDPSGDDMCVGNATRRPSETATSPQVRLPESPEIPPAGWSPSRSVAGWCCQRTYHLHSGRATLRSRWRWRSQFRGGGGLLGRRATARKAAGDGGRRVTGRQELGRGCSREGG